VTNEHLNRRDFNRLTSVALGGMVAGSALATSVLADAKEKDKDKKKAVHVCRGLNVCKGKGVFGKSACAGQGACATAAYHACAGKNACKGQGGCGEKPGQNACKGKGKCAVPLSDKAWKSARAAFEKRMKEMDKKYGDPPPKDETPQGNKKLREKVKKQRAQKKAENKK